MQQLVKFKQSTNNKYDIYISCYEIVADDEENVVDLIQTSLSQTEKSHKSYSRDSVKTESEMQEIYVDSDSLEELIMVIEDVFAKRKTVQVKNEVFTMSHLLMKVRITDKADDDSYQNQREIVLIDLSELNEPIEPLTEMFHILGTNERSLSIDTRI